MRHCMPCAIPALCVLGACGTVPQATVSGGGEPDVDAAKFAEHARLVDEVTPFMEVDYGAEPPTLAFEEDAARAAGLSEEMIRFGIEAAELVNRMPGDQNLEEGAAKHAAEPAPWARRADWYSWFRPIADPCGSWTNARRYEPYRDRAATEAALLAAGYHRTLIPGRQGYNDRDWTRAVQHTGVPMSTGHAPTRAGAYRYHAQIAVDGRSYTVQGAPTPEPNPEWHTYLWPTWWWPLYAQWHHEVSGC